MTYWKNKVSKLSSVRKCAKSHLPNKIILLELSKQLLPGRPIVSVGVSPLLSPLPSPQAGSGPSRRPGELSDSRLAGRKSMAPSERCMWFSKMERVAPDCYSVRRQRGLSG